MQRRHNATRFPLVGVHAGVDCQSCHAAGRYADLPLDCIGCHRASYESSSNPDHRAARFAIDCLNCHRLSAASGWQTAAYQHTAAFPLNHAHSITDCRACHSGQANYADASPQCYSCHRQNYESVSNPNHAASGFNHDCSVCHNLDGWTPAHFDHSLARFPLTGAHRTVGCSQCHIGGRYTGTPSACFTCHEHDYNAATAPSHTAGQFNHDCTECHITDAWRPAAFNHETTAFPLTGAHRTVNCEQCHIGGQYGGNPTACYDCHINDYNSVSTPNHATGQFNHDCLICHTTDAWQPATFNHETTAFPLTGAHRTVNCELCHISGQYGGNPTDCYTCHLTDYNDVTTPNHVSGQFNHDCLICHTTDAWQPATFNHETTAFPLTGAHRTVNCEQCHIGGQYGSNPTDCYTCHLSDYNDVADPNHATGQFNRDCLICHTTDAWQPSTLDHDRTDFPLTGAHRAVNCEQCHIGGQYGGNPTTCFGCHEADFNGVSDPNHAAGQFNHDCTVCHTTDAWSPATFNHDATDFPLTGAHRAVNCEQCHIGGQYGGNPTTCFGCHEADFNGVSDPNHAAGQFNHDCTVCHTTVVWSPSTFDHDSTAFQLVGAHRMVNCEQCHIGGQYGGNPTTCFGCHEADYNGVADPNHAAGQFNHDCTVCHNTDAWSPATFEHDSSGFPLTGAHRQVNCSECHSDGFNNTPTDCYFCHDNDYNDARDPNHSAAGFPHDCESCHNTNNWNDADFDHDGRWFPIYGGTHRNAWSRCSDCHTNANDYSVFTCIDCHEHNRQDTDEHHQEVGDYEYNSAACYQCHPRGTAEGGFRRNDKPQYRRDRQ
jgi:hypothetical protein